MKLDKVRFAKLIATICCIGESQRPIDEEDIRLIDDIIDIAIPEVPASRTNAEQLDRLMALMVEGTQKIEAIKVHRAMTGYNLKDSKDEVEKYWAVPKPDKSKIMLAKVDQQLQAGDNGFGFTLEGFTSYQLNKVKEFIESF